MYDLVQSLEKNLDRQIGFVRASEAKLSILIPAISISFALCVAILKASDTGNIYSIIFGLISFGMVFWSFICTYLAMFPRTNGPNDSLIYFGSIAEKPEGFLNDDFNSMGEDRYKKELINQIYMNSKIANLKYKYFQQALKIWYFSLMPTLVFAVLSWEKLLNGTGLQ